MATHAPAEETKSLAVRLGVVQGNFEEVLCDAEFAYGFQTLIRLWRVQVKREAYRELYERGYQGVLLLTWLQSFLLFKRVCIQTVDE